MNDSEPAAWSSGSGTDSAEPLRQLVARLEDDQRTRWQRGERVLVEAYLEQHPTLQVDPDAIVDLLYHEFLLRQEAGEAPQWEEYLARFPQLTRQLHAQFEVHEAVQSGQAFGSAQSSVTTSAACADCASSVAAPADLLAVPGYEILKELGRGGMGVVYWAWQMGLNRTVALKMIRAVGHAGPQELARFRTEAEAVARLQHPHIVQIYAVGQEKELPYIALEYVDGSSLAQQIGGTPLPARHTAQLVETLARAMHYAHLRGIVHRDLTPANVLLTSDGVPKITDFGLAKILVGGGRVQTQSGAIVGTPSYMAPEQAAGKSKDIGPAADIYALGALLYELLTGRPPFKAETPLETLFQVQTLEPVSPSRLQPKIPRDLTTICLKCLQKEPHKRYASAEALAEDLRRFLVDEPIRARRASRAERLWRWWRRNPALATASGLAVVAFVAVVALAVGIAVMQSLAATGLRQEQGKTIAALEEAKKLSSRLAREQGLYHKEQKNVGAGMLWLARSLEIGPHDPEFQRLNRANLAGWYRELRPLRAIWGQPGRIDALAFSRDGKTVVIGDQTGTAQIWDAATGKPVGPPLRHEGAIQAVAFSPDGKVVLTGSDDSTARLWSAATGEPIGKPLQHHGKLWTAVFSPDGRVILTGSEDNTARLWSTATGQPIGKPLQHRGKVLTVAFSPDGKTVLTGSDDHTACFWDAASGESLNRVLPHGGTVRTVAFSPNGQTVLTGSDDRTAHLWDAATGTPIGKPLPHGGMVRAVAFSPDGQTILTTSEDTFARLWSAATGALIKELPHDAITVNSIAFSPDGRTVVTGSDDGTARLWSAASGESLSHLRAHQASVNRVAFSPDGQFLLTGDESGAARLWEVTLGKPTAFDIPHTHYVASASFSPDGRAILTGSGDPINAFLRKSGEAQLWDADTGQPLGPAIPHDIVVMAVAFRPDGKVFATGTGNPLQRYRKNKVQLWETISRQPFGRPLEHGGPVFAMVFSPDGQTLLTGCDDHTARLWDVANGNLIEALNRPNRVCAVAFSPDGTKFLTGDADGHAQLWDTVTRKPLGEPLWHPKYVMGVAFSPDGQTILTGCEDCAARLWNAATGRPIGKPLLHQGWVRAVAFSSDGKTLLTGSGDGTAQLWEAATGKPLGARLQHKHWVVAAAFRPPDGRWVLTGSTDRTARLWDVKPEPVQGTVERILLWTQVITGMEMDADGQFHVLDGPNWQQRRQRLEELGGPPLP